MGCLAFLASAMEVPREVIWLVSSTMAGSTSSAAGAAAAGCSALMMLIFSVSMIAIYNMTICLLLLMAMVVRHYDTIYVEDLSCTLLACRSQQSAEDFVTTNLRPPTSQKIETSTWILSDVIDVRIHEHVINTVHENVNKKAGQQPRKYTIHHDEARR